MEIGRSASRMLEAACAVLAVLWREIVALRADAGRTGRPG
jgi:hypothetical protein